MGNIPSYDLNKVLSEPFPGAIITYLPVSIKQILQPVIAFIRKTLLAKSCLTEQKLKPNIAFSDEKLILILIGVNILKIDYHLNMSKSSSYCGTSDLLRCFRSRLRVELFAPFEKTVVKIKAFETERDEAHSFYSKWESVDLATKKVDKVYLTRDANIYMRFLFPFLGIAMAGFTNCIWKFLYANSWKAESGIYLHNLFYHFSAYFCKYELVKLSYSLEEIIINSWKPHRSLGSMRIMPESDLPCWWYSETKKREYYERGKNLNVNSNLPEINKNNIFCLFFVVIYKKLIN